MRENTSLAALLSIERGMAEGGLDSLHSRYRVPDICTLEVLQCNDDAEKGCEEAVLLTFCVGCV